MRGEHCCRINWRAMELGSSPHARGARLRGEDAPAPGGIIPACAGSTGPTRPSMSSCRDHPRMRGEHVVPRSTSYAAKGSSPHARGALLHDPEGRPHFGIIPACAGSTPTTAASARTSGDHPRMRGEHPPGTSVMTWYLGSSPHARGAPIDAPDDVVTEGIIPACAGSTWDCGSRTP